MLMHLDAGPVEDSETLQIATRKQGTTTVIELAGEWDLAGTPAVDRAIAAVLEGRPEFVVLDVTRLTFIDSSGLHATVELALRADTEGVRLAIIVDSPSVWRPFQVCGLTERLPLIDACSGDRAARAPASTRELPV